MYNSSGKLPERGNELLSGRYACYNLYQCADARWLSIGALEHKFWKTLCQVLGHPELAEEQFAPEPRQSEIKSQIASIFATSPAMDWFARLRDKDCCVAPVLTLDEVTVPIGLGPTLRRTPPSLDQEAPALGQHTAAILNELNKK
jgi:crotonobetainyl-CoA:carnitine CoA-transferase CaiB-like acyl-CoA transferase